MPGPVGVRTTYSTEMGLVAGGSATRPSFKAQEIRDALGGSVAGTFMRISQVALWPDGTTPTAEQLSWSLAAACLAPRIST